VSVAYLSDDDMFSVLEFRKAIEGYTAELAAKKANAGDITNMEKIYAKMEQMKGDVERFSQADYEFHYELAVISRNSLIIECYNLIGDLFRTAMKHIVEERGHSQGLYYHRLIIDRITAKDTDGCRILMTEHIDNTYSDMLSRHKIRNSAEIVS